MENKLYHLTLFRPGWAIMAPPYQTIAITFEREVVLPLNFLTFPKILIDIKCQKKIFSRKCHVAIVTIF